MSTTPPQRRQGLTQVSGNPAASTAEGQTNLPESVEGASSSSPPSTPQSGTRSGLPRTPEPTAEARSTSATATAEPLAEATPAPDIPATDMNTGLTIAGPRRWVLTVGVSLLIGVIVVVGVVVGARWFATLGPIASYLERYPGDYELPEGSPVGIPVWLAWQHFFNAFFMLLIIRSGLTVRYQRKPPAYWTSRRKPSAKVSLTVWFHQSVDVLWLVNGLLYVVLLLSTGQWVRIIPTSGEVFPNALSALLQYATLDWPTDNGWVHYNSLQQLAYFTTIFVAAPLAALSGWRLSTVWPDNVAWLNRIYPVNLARRIHFPVMWYTVFFIVIHVVLVLSTGALRNLNHMYAAQGSTDPAAFSGNWAGFWMFVVSVAVFVGAWFAAHPLVLASIARLFGTVSAR